MKQARLRQRRRGAEEEEGEEAEGGRRRVGGEGGGMTGASLTKLTGKGEGRRATRVVGSCARGVWAI